MMEATVPKLGLSVDLGDAAKRAKIDDNLIGCRRPAPTAVMICQSQLARQSSIFRMNVVAPASSQSGGEI